jgi:nucleotide-binding universal stress UspA family protein
MMTVKTILAAASGGTASAGAVELACRFARRFNAHVEGFHAKPDPFDLVKYDAVMGASVLTDAFIKRFTADADANAAKVRSEFTAALQRHGMDLSRHAPNELPGQIGGSAVWHEEVGGGPTLVARRARFFDLVVLGRSERVIENPHSDTVEQTLLQSGRPVLLAPAKAPEVIGDSIALGWNGSAAAVRAMIGVLPFLATAESVVVVSIGERHQGSAKSALDYLAWHDVKAKHVHVPTVTGASAGQQLLSAARDEGADLLAMGGYGHTPWREFLFGGATRDIVGVSLLPLLLTH